MDKKKLVRQLSHFIPSETINPSDEMSYLELIELSIFKEDKPITIDEIRNNLNKYYGLTFQRDFIEERLQILLKNEKIRQVIESYDLSVTERSKYEILMQKDSEIEVYAINSWKEYLVQKYSLLDEAEVNNLQEDLKIFVKTTFITHGIESISLISDEFNEYSVDINLIDIINNLPSRDKNLHIIRKEEFPFFLADFKNKEYLINILDKSLRYLMCICSEDIVKSIKEKIKGKEMYLDTSVIFRLLDLQGENRKKIVDDVVELCNQFEIKIIVHRNTMKEFLRRISYDSKRLLNSKMDHKFDSLATKYSNHEDFLTSYWRQSNGGKLAVKDFIEKYENSEYILTNSGIILDEKIFTKEDNSEVRKCALNYEYKFRDYLEHSKRKSRSELSIEHDCFMLSYINSRRNCHSKVLIDCDCWFLTTDHAVLNFQNALFDLKHSPAISILPSHVIQLLRFVQTENGKYDETFISIFSSNTVFSSNSLSPSLVHEILERISLHSNNEIVAERILVNGTLTRRLQDMESDKERADLIEESLEAIYTEMEEENNKLHSTVSNQVQLINNQAQELEEKNIEIEKQKIELLKKNDIQKKHENESNAYNEKMNKTRQLLTNKTEELVELRDKEVPLGEIERQCIKKFDSTKKFIGLLLVIFVLLLAYLYQKKIVMANQFSVFEPYTFFTVFISVFLAIINLAFPNAKINILKHVVFIFNKLIEWRKHYNSDEHKHIKNRIITLEKDIEDLKNLLNS